MHRIKHLGFNAIKESFDRLPTGVCFFDRTGSIVLCNRQMYRLCHVLMGRDLQYLDELRAVRALDRQFVPAMEEERRRTLLAGWHKAVGRSLDWAEHT